MPHKVPGVFALAILISKKRLLQWATGHQVPGVLLQAARSFERFANKGKAKQARYMPGSMLLTNASTGQAPMPPIPAAKCR